MENVGCKKPDSFMSQLFIWYTFPLIVTPLIVTFPLIVTLFGDIFVTICLLNGFKNECFKNECQTSMTYSDFQIFFRFLKKIFQKFLEIRKLNLFRSFFLYIKYNWFTVKLILQ